MKRGGVKDGAWSSGRFCLRKVGRQKQSLPKETAQRAATLLKYAEAFVLMTGYFCTEQKDRSAGGVDDFDDLNMAKLLEWLNLWKRGMLARAHCEDMGPRAGGSYDDLMYEDGWPCDKRMVWRWEEALWAPPSGADDDDERGDARPAAGSKAGVGRRWAPHAAKKPTRRSSLSKVMRVLWWRSGSTRTSVATFRAGAP